MGTTVAGITGSYGSALAQLYNPSAIYVNSNETMFILDSYNYRILQWQIGNPFGTVIVNGRGSGSSLSTIGLSYAFCFDNQNNIYVSEYGNHRVTKWLSGNNNMSQLVRFSYFCFLIKVLKKLF